QGLTGCDSERFHRQNRFELLAKFFSHAVTLQVCMQGAVSAQGAACDNRAGKRCGGRAAFCEKGVDKTVHPRMRLNRDIEMRPAGEVCFHETQVSLAVAVYI